MKFVLKSRPKIGDCRKRLKFAWFPVTAINQERVGIPTNYLVWLETIEVYEEYRRHMVATKFGGMMMNEWVEVFRYIKE
jgi:hypothetical protein